MSVRSSRLGFDSVMRTSRRNRVWPRLEAPGSMDGPRSVNRAVSLLRERGPAHVPLVLLRLATSCFLRFGRVVFFVREIDGQWETPDTPAGITLRLACPSELPRLVSGRPPEPGLADRFGQRFRRGDLCIVAVEADGAVARSSWVTTAPTWIPELDMEIVPRPGEAYLYDGYTRPDARRRGIDGAVRCFVFDMLRAAAFTRVYSYCRGDNAPALRAANRWQTPVGKMWFVRLRGLEPWVNPGHAHGAPSLARDLRDRRPSGAEWPHLRRAGKCLRDADGS